MSKTVTQSRPSRFTQSPANKSNFALKMGDSSSMPNATKMTYFEQEDILHLVISDECESDSIEIAPNVTAELNEAGELIGIEILRASTFIRDSILESVQGKLLGISPPKSA
jgi:uncharacterized protein YuzE